MKYPAKQLGKLAMTSGLLLLGACSQAPDLSAVKQERERALQRHDIIQSMASNGKVIAAGTQSGVVLVSADSGKSWKRNILGPVSLVDLKTCPDGSFVGIDFYHQVWSGDAAGQGWKAAKLEEIRTPLALTCDSKGRWWVTGPSTRIAVSADKGTSWQVTDLGKDAQITTIQFVSDSVGYATGEFGLFLVTRDGGAKWQISGTTDKDFYPYSAWFKDEQEGWVSGIAGKILHTTDGGKRWSRQTNTTGAPLYRLFGHQGKVYGAGAVGTVARLEGTEWRAMPYPDAVPVFLGAAASIPDQSALALGGPGGLLRVVSTAK